MHVGLNLIYLVPRRTGGMEIAARELIPALAQARPDLRLTAFINRETAGEPGPWRDVDDCVVVPVRAQNRIQWVRGEQQLLPGLAARRRVDVLHSLGATAPVRGAVRRVVTIHDFTYQLFPDSHHRLYGLGLRLLIGAGVRRSHRVIACSQHTAGDAQRLLGVAPGEIDVVPWGLGARAVAAPTPEAELRARLALADRRVLLALSDKRPHKNLVRLVQALARLPAGRRPALVIAGYSTPYERELRRRIAELELEDDVRVCDWVSDGDREGLYALASAFVFPSLYEGFGLPVLEAMARGLPVASSNAASLPELTGDAALSFDPRDVDAITAALARVLDDGALVARLRAAGPARAARFTWQRAAELTLASYDRALG